MKKLYLGLLVIPMVFSLAACRKTKVKNPGGNVDTSSLSATYGNYNKNYSYNTNFDEVVSHYNTDTSTEYKSIVFYNWDYVDYEGTLVVNTKRIDSLALKVGTTIDQLPAPTSPREGWTFVGWYVDASLSTPFYYTEMPNGDLTAYAKYEISNNTIFVSPTGNALNDGTKSSSAMTISAAARLYKAGATIKIAGGTYDLSETLVFSSQGSANAVTTIEPRNSSDEVILNFGEMSEADANQGIKLCGDYHNISNITVKDAGDNGILVGSSYNTISRCILTENSDTGLQIARFAGSIQPTLNTWPSNNQILNCTSYNNSDNAGEDADGFAAKLTVGQGNVFDGCLSYWNVDDGWDLYSKQDSGCIGLVTIRNCVAWGNGRRLTSDKSKVDTGFSGDGNGFKLGGSSMKGEVIVENCLAAYNYAHGFTDNSNPGCISIKNCTSVNNGLFNSGAKSTKEYDNFNLNRSSIFENKNYYEGLFSYYNNDGKKANTAYKSDEFNGSLVNSVLIYNQQTYKVAGSLSIQMGEGFVGSKQVSAISLTDEICNIVDPQTLITKYKTSNFESNLRNIDGSINLGGLFAVNTTTLGIACGANLSQSSSDGYNHNSFIAASENETADETISRNIYNALNLAVNSDYIYNDIYLPTTYFDQTITWTSSNTSVISISSNVTTVENGTSYTHGVIPGRVDEDTAVTLTATWTVGSVTKTKSFTLTVQGLDPRLGEVNGIVDINQLDNSTNVIDINDVSVNDYTSTNVTLIKDSDYTVTTKVEYQSDYGEAKVTKAFDQTVAGIYTITYTFKVNGYADYSLSRVITIVNHNDTYKVISSDTGLGYIIDNAINVTAKANYNEGTVYAVATTSSITSLTAEEIMAGVKDGIISNVVSQEVSSLTFNLKVALNSNYVDETEANIFLFIKNTNGNGEVASILNVKPTILIDSYAEFKEYLTTSAGMTGAFKLTKDIDAAGDTWEQTAGNPIFKGYFDGAYYTVKNLNINVSNTDGGGLFFKADGQAIIKNLALNEVFVTQTDAATFENGGKVGILVGEIKGGATIENIYILNCGANSIQRTGGLVGQVSGGDVASTTTINNIIIESTHPGDMKYAITSSYKTINGEGFETSTGGKYVGGIIAHVQYNSSVAGNVLSVSNCYVNAEIHIYNQFAAGIIGRMDPQKEATTTIDKCVFAGSITSRSSYVGGIIAGRNSGLVTVSNCINNGSLSGSGVGQIISQQMCSKKAIGTTNVYSVNTDYVTMTKCYWGLNDYDAENSDITEEAYITQNTENKEYYGQYVYKSKLKLAQTYVDLIGISLDTFTITDGTFALNCFKK